MDEVSGSALADAHTTSVRVALVKINYGRKISNSHYQNSDAIGHEFPKNTLEVKFTDGIILNASYSAYGLQLYKYIHHLRLFSTTTKYLNK